MEKFSGKKTYICAVLLGAATFAKAVGWLDDNSFQVVMSILGALGLAALRSGVQKSGPTGP
jgi:hypothetical protein